MQAATQTDQFLPVPFSATTMAGFEELSTDGPDFTGFRRKLGLGHQPVVVVAVLADTHRVFRPEHIASADGVDRFPKGERREIFYAGATQ